MLFVREQNLTKHYLQQALTLTLTLTLTFDIKQSLSFQISILS